MAWTFDQRLEARFHRILDAWFRRQAAQLKDANAGNARDISFSTITRGDSVAFMVHIAPSEVEALSADLLFAYKTTLAEDNFAVFKVVPKTPKVAS